MSGVASSDLSPNATSQATVVNLIDVDTLSNVSDQDILQLWTLAGAGLTTPTQPNQTPPPTAIEQLVEELNILADGSLSARREAIIRDWRAVNGDDGVVHFQSGYPRKVWLAMNAKVIWAVSIQLGVHLAQVFALPPNQRGAAIKDMIAAVTVAAAVVGASATMKKKIIEVLTKGRGAQLLRDYGGWVGKEARGFALKSNSTLFALFSAIANCAEAIQFYFKAVLARREGGVFEDANAAYFQRQAVRNFGPHAAVTLLTQSVTGAALACALGPLTLTTAAVFPVAAYFIFGITDALADMALEKASPRDDGWAVWVKSWVYDVRPKEWMATNEITQRAMRNISEELYCPISGALIVDPVRCILNGRVYEKRYIRRWIRDHHTDPFSPGIRNISWTKHYERAGDVEFWLKKYQKMLNLSLVPEAGLQEPTMQAGGNLMLVDEDVGEGVLGSD